MDTAVRITAGCLLGALLAARLGRVLRQTPARQGTISP